MSKALNFAIIGCGVIAPSHAAAINHVNGAKLYAVCDIIKEKADSFSEKFGSEKIYYDYKELLKDVKVDVVCVCVPSGLHGEISIAAAQSGKNIVCEKPMEITNEKNAAVIEAVRSCGVKMQCIFQRRTMTAAVATKKAIEEGRLGKIVLASAYLKYYRDQDYYNSAGWRGTWELDGGGALMNQGVHGVDLLCWMVGEKVISIFAKAGTLARNIEVEDTAVAILQFDGGGYGVIEGATTVYPGLDTKFEIHGEYGTIIFTDSGIEKWEFLKESVTMPQVSEKMGGASNPADISSQGHLILIQDMVNAINENREPMIPPEEGKNAVKIIRAIYTSSSEKREVFL